MHRCIFRPVSRYAHASPHPARRNSANSIPAVQDHQAPEDHQAPQDQRRSSATATEVFPSGLTIVRASAKGQASMAGLHSSQSMPDLGSRFTTEGGAPWNAQMYMIPTAVSLCSLGRG